MTRSSLYKLKTRVVPAAVYHFSMRQFLVALIILVISYPFISDLNEGDLIERLLMMILLISGAFAVGGRSRLVTIILIAPAIVGYLMDQFRHGWVPAWLLTGADMVFVGFVIIQLIRYILRAPQVNAEVLCAGISAYLMLAIFWAPAYLMVSELNPASFACTHLATGQQALNQFDTLYLSFVSLTCVGCNDITPLSKVARMFLMTEAATGVLYLAVLIARLVALYTHAAQASHREPAKHD